MTPIIKRRAFHPDQSTLADLTPLLQRIFTTRGVSDPADLEISLKYLLSTEHLTGIDSAVDRLEIALRNQDHIVIVADFDADGATSCAVAMRALHAMGAQSVDYIVPNRFEYGYGLTPPIVELAKQSQPDLLITVDNGISSIDGVALARTYDIDVVITDHHLPPRVLPNANAIVNPNLDGDEFPSKALAGVGVIFYVMMALRARLREKSWFEKRGIAEPNLAQLLDLVALGTVADVVPLDRNNRCLVGQGLARIRAGQMQAGIRALFDVAGVNSDAISSTDLGFAIGPRLNAAGRLADMSLGIECLLSDDAQKCQQIAQSLDGLNRERREIEAEMKDQAISVLEQMVLDEQSLPAGLALFDSDWHQGVVGVVASRIKDKYHRPVIAFAPSEDQQIKGSGRSIPGIHLRDVLDAIATKHPSLLDKFGGHAMAAGLTIAEQDFETFQEIFSREIRDVLGEVSLHRIIETDGPLDEQSMTLEIAQTLSRAAPWGQHFPEPLFDDVFDIVESRVVGEHHLKLRLRRVGGQQVFDAIAFYAVNEPWAGAQSALRFVYRLAVNEYRGRRCVQLIIEFATSDMPLTDA